MNFKHSPTGFASLPADPTKINIASNGAGGSQLLCPICLSQVSKLVRDHNHQTGYIRGCICDQCNGWLGLLERFPENYYLRKKPGRRRWRRWVYDNAERIWLHLQRNTGEIYSRKKLRAMRRDAVRDPQIKSGSAPVTTTRSGFGESRANTPSNSRPKTGSLCPPDEKRREWARQLMQRARGVDSSLSPNRSGP